MRPCRHSGKAKDDGDELSSVHYFAYFMDLRLQRLCKPRTEERVLMPRCSIILNLLNRTISCIKTQLVVDILCPIHLIYLGIDTKSSKYHKEHKYNLFHINMFFKSCINCNNFTLKITFLHKNHKHSTSFIPYCSYNDWDVIFLIKYIRHLLYQIQTITNPHHPSGYTHYHNTIIYNNHCIVCQS